MAKRAQGESDTRQRTANRITYEAALAWRQNELVKLEAYRNRALALLSVVGIILAVGMRLGAASFLSRPNDTTRLAHISLTIIAIGLVAVLVSVVRLLQPLSARFEQSPTNISDLGKEKYRSDLPTSAEIYGYLAKVGHRECDELASTVGTRCNWLYASILGLFAVIAGVALIWWTSVS